MEIKKDDISTTMADFLNRDNIVFDDACFPSKIKLRSESYENFNLNKFNYPVSSIVSGIVDTNTEDNGWSYTVIGDKAFYTDEEKAIKLKQEKFARLCKNVGIDYKENAEEQTMTNIPSDNQEENLYMFFDTPVIIPSGDYQNVQSNDTVIEKDDSDIKSSVEFTTEVSEKPIEVTQESSEETEFNLNDENINLDSNSYLVSTSKVIETSLEENAENSDLTSEEVKSENNLYSELSIEANDALLAKIKLDETKNELKNVQENSSKQIEESYNNLFSKSDQYEEVQNILEEKQFQELEIDKKILEAREKQAEVLKLIAEKAKKEMESTKEEIQNVNDSARNVLEENNNNISYFDEAIQNVNADIYATDSRIIEKQAIMESMMNTFEEPIQEEPVRRVA